ncbi:MAG: two-component system KDP operon response regulator KdpE, partial [Myxococcota bacterium]
MTNDGKNRLNLSSALVDLNGWYIRRDKTEHRLTPTEHRLLSWMLAHPGQLFSQAELLQNVWHYHADVYSRTVYSTIQRLRKKLEKDPSHPRHLISVYGA